MAGAAGLLDEAGRVMRGLAGVGVQPILVGGMALVILGSRRVTRDFDFVIPHPGDQLETIVDVIYDAGLELAARVDADGEITATISNRRMAAARLRLDAPASAYSCNPTSGLRVDLLFDFPIPAATLAEHATRLTIRSVAFHVASEADLLHLKKLALTRRRAPGDAEDVAFLEARRSRR